MSVIFDLDGTLIDSAPDIHGAVNHMLRDVGVEPLTMVEVRSFIGNGVRVLVQRVMDARGLTAPHPDLLARFLLHYNAAPAVLTLMYPGVRAALVTLRDFGHPLGICTNKPEATTRMILQAFDLEQFFISVIGGDTLPVHKPDPAPLLSACAALGGDCVFVGDSEVDAETAVRAGVPFVLFTQGYRRGPVEAAAQFADYAALPGVLLGMAGV